VVNITNIIPINAAMWDKDGEMNLSIGTKSINHSLVKDWKRGTQNVRTMTWDTLVKGIGKIKLANIDIEGAEIQMLNGMTRNLPQFIILERHEFFGLKPEDILKPLIEKGYSLDNQDIYTYAHL
jgi:FkbM family methyltransferase